MDALKEKAKRMKFQLDLPEDENQISEIIVVAGYVDNIYLLKAAKSSCKWFSDGGEEK